jgi:hypothetical protein
MASIAFDLDVALLRYSSYSVPDPPWSFYSAALVAEGPMSIPAS